MDTARKAPPMSARQTTAPTCFYDDNAATFVVEYADGDRHRRACDAHFAKAYREATEANATAFLPVYIGTLQEVVAL